MSTYDPDDVLEPSEYARYAAHAQHAIALLTLWADATTDDPAALLGYFDKLQLTEQHQAVLSLVALIAALVDVVGGSVEEFVQVIGLNIAEYLS